MTLFVELEELLGATRAARLVMQAMTHRHQIAHGVNPRPVIHNQYSSLVTGVLRADLDVIPDTTDSRSLSERIGIPVNPWLRLRTAI